MSTAMEKRLNECDRKIDALFRGVEFNEEIERQLKALKAYYHKLYIDALDGESEKESIKLYELLVLGLESAKNGELNTKEVLKELKEIKSLRKNGVVLENILTSLELLFWAALSSTIFSYCVLMAAPLVAINPFFALSVLSVFCVTAICSTVRFFNCLDEFKSFAPIEEEFDREKNLIRFFKPSVSSPELPASDSYEFTQKEGLSYQISQV
ncbi:DUF5638 domain-containing protein [Legionella parisiensis]|uniref:DUF5638 domain-containing protein n=1 Tax=Legionella parisiensis TaxID=45071 RepID=A0A1E5JQ35_9GAMM|nr:DUF5638 domain-containing protein [Legionella parisiensis]KTD41400.1 hypothetical protein Lpar_2717 [Legionella parisiensis]OEH46148.1 hypothetical protein lpari_02881 [Legionella parisiensis]STX76297.1 Uncharacterised protein [Legionella parisiensis]